MDKYAAVFHNTCYVCLFVIIRLRAIREESHVIEATNEV